MRNKRRWSWKKKHVRKHQFTYKSDGPPKDYRKIFHAGNRQKERTDLRKFEKGDCEVDFNPKYHHHCAAWFWW